MVERQRIVDVGHFPNLKFGKLILKKKFIKALSKLCKKF